MCEESISLHERKREMSRERRNGRTGKKWVCTLPCAAVVYVYTP